MHTVQAISFQPKLSWFMDFGVYVKYIMSKFHTGVSRNIRALIRISNSLLENRTSHTVLRSIWLKQLVIKDRNALLIILRIIRRQCLLWPHPSMECSPSEWRIPWSESAVWLTYSNSCCPPRHNCQAADGNCHCRADCYALYNSGCEDAHCNSCDRWRPKN